MSRSVDYLNRANAVAYIDASHLVSESTDQWEWDDFVNDIVYQLQDKYPSLTEPYKKTWDSNEVEIILRNMFCDVGISEYMGLVSVSIRADEYNPLAVSWVNKIKDEFLKIGDLNKVGTFSNGEAVYKRIKK